MTARRGFITGLISFVAAPAIVRPESLMAVREISIFQTLVECPNMTATEILERFADLKMFRRTFVSQWNEAADIYLP
jgi:hypothetical protein